MNMVLRIAFIGRRCPFMGQFFFCPPFCPPFSKIYENK
nr:MAG TPA: putative metal-binding protein [Caudoviricetes sp.]